jgi:ectoine hydroxylase-related dioxygenase (phytanoyl-CoA dioxygenase family)
LSIHALSNVASLSWHSRFLDEGFAILPTVFSPAEVEVLVNSLEALGQSESIRRRGGIFAARNLLTIAPQVRALADSSLIRSIIEPVLGSQAFPVRGILFDKTPSANWKVPWHQDLTIAVMRRIETVGFGPWSVKAEIQHVQPPESILENMLSVRIHLDDCGVNNGPLRVIPGSHKQGKLPETEVAYIGKTGRAELCTVSAGGIVLMRPLLLHASSACEAPFHRRVIHLDFASTGLPGQLQWFEEPLN